MSHHDDCYLDENCGRADCPAVKAIAARATANALPEWGALKIRTGPGGERHYLQGKAVHCGAGLRLQRVEERHDDYGSYTVRHDDGVPVRYEASWGPGGVSAALYTMVGGHVFARDVESYHRLRWPEWSK